jgi:predicted ribosomally synthesized peptide with SipW-like signal peptide
MKKKFLAISLVVILLAVAIAGGTLAWFTDTDEVKNVFTIGSVEIVQNETNADGSAFTQNQQLLPIVNTADPAADGNYIDKIITVSNTGKNPAYIRTYIAVPKALLGVLQIDVKTDNWSFVDSAETSIGGMSHMVYYFDYNYSLTPQETSDKLLQGVYLKSNVDLEEDASGNLVFILRDGNGNKTHSSGFVAHTKNADGTYTSAAVDILVASQAIQAQGFDNGATDALDSGFGANSNPWQ